MLASQCPVIISIFTKIASQKDPVPRDLKLDHERAAAAQSVAAPYNIDF